MNDRKAYIEYKDILMILEKRKLTILLVFVIALSISVLCRIFLMKPMYEARSSIIIGNALDNGETQFLLNDVNNIQDYMKTYVMLLNTNLIAEKTMKALNLNMRVSEFKKHIQGIPQSKTQFMDITVVWDNPEQASAVLDTITATFIQEALRIYPKYSIHILEKVGPEPAEALSDKLYYIISIISSSMIAFLVVLAAQYFDNTIASEGDIEELLKIPVIGTIPNYKGLKLSILDSMKNNHYFLFYIFQVIKMNLLTRNLNMKSIVITSACPREGKTTIASMLAVILAQGGKKTLLIDCNLRNPGIHKTFEIKGAGLANLLMEDTNWSDVITESCFQNLYILSAGFNILNPVELISSDVMNRLITELKEVFDYIILDTPPLGLFTEALILSQFTDGYLIVVSARESDKAITQKAVRLLQYADGKIIGTLLNKTADSKLYREYSHYLAK